MTKEASYYFKINDEILCELCPHNCKISEGKRGICGVRKNVNGKLIAETYSRVSALGMDPIEKKPLYHFYPGKQILSVGSIGCNLKCVFCQNCDISQANPDDTGFLKSYTVDEIIDISLEKRDNIGVSFTYNEPTIFYEFMYDIARVAKLKGQKTTMVTNGFISKDPLKELLPYMDAFNVDLKAFSNAFYKRYTKSDLNPVLSALKQIKNAEKHLEITNLVIPMLNDNEDEFSKMIAWICDHLGEDTVLHISKYFPRYKLDIQSTPLETLMRMYHIAKSKLPYVYLGNVIDKEGKDTWCPECDQLVISRSGYDTKIVGLDNQGRCKNCEHHIIKDIEL